jgi:hypothetical protein
MSNDGSFRVDFGFRLLEHYRPEIGEIKRGRPRGAVLTRDSAIPLRPPRGDRTQALLKTLS